jgi:hypothetical protein
VSQGKDGYPFSAGIVESGAIIHVIARSRRLAMVSAKENQNTGEVMVEAWGVDKIL